MNPVEMNDYRLIAFMSHFDSSQFTYRSNRGVEDDVSKFLQKLYVPRSFVRSVFIDFSSAFNSFVPHILIDKLLSLDVTPQLALVIHNFLTDSETTEGKV